MPFSLERWRCPGGLNRRRLTPNPLFKFSTSSEYPWPQSKSPTLPGIIDSHAHLNMGHMAEDPSAVLGRARAAGVSTVITIGTTLAESREAVALAEAHPEVFATVGIHPHDAVEHPDADLAALKAMTDHPKVVAIGEIGLDYHYDHSPREVQRHWFRRQMALAEETGLPVVVHTREAEDDTAAILQAFPAVTGVMHCYSSGMALAETALDMGYMLSFSGIVTFKAADAVRAVAERTPLDRMLVETDCPYLAPVPFRGKPNEPAYVTLVAEKLAEIKGVKPEDLVAATTANTRKLFRLS